MRIRLFNTYEPVTTIYRDLAPYFTSLGHKVEIIISKAEYRTGRDLKSAFCQIDGISIYQTINFGFQPGKGIGKVLVMAMYIIHTALYTLFGPGVDRNIFLTQPPLFPLWGYLLAKVRRQPYYCVVMDIYPQLMVEYGMLPRHALWTKILAWFSLQALSHADGVIVIGRCMAERLKAMGVNPERIHLIPNWIDERIVSPVEHSKNELRKKWGLEGKFVVLYSGNMGLSHYFDDILTVAEQMKSRADLIFVFVGGGSRYKEIKERVENRNLTNVQLFPFQDIDNLAQSLSVGDLHLVTLQNSCTGLAVPSKSYGILAVGRPIIYQGSSEGEIARMIEENNIGMVIPIGAVDRLKEAVESFIGHPEITKEMGCRARKLMESKYNRSYSVERYAEVLGISHS